LIEGKRQWHRPGRTLPLPDKSGVPTLPSHLPAEAGVPPAFRTPVSTGSSPGTPTSAGSPGTPDSFGSSSPFLGWHERGYLPHFDAPNVTQFVTFMLHDAFPVTRRREWESALHEPDESARRRQLEAWLDRGHGECWLRQPPIADLVENRLREHDGANYRLQAWCVMPNHVHLVVDVWQTPLSQLLKLWKGGSARAANLALGRGGRVLGTGILRHTHPGRGTPAQSHPLHGSESGEGGPGAGTEGLGVEQCALAGRV
jgi:hypothetical protein